MGRNFLIDCKAGDLVNDVFVVTNAQLAASSNGKHYIKAFVSDRTAQLTARLWNATREQFAAMPENAFVWVRGRVENYQNNLQLIIEEFRRPEEGTFDVGELLPHTTRDIEEMCQRVFAILGSIKHEETKALVQAFLDDEDLMNDFARAPAASSFHHAYIGGLLEHTLNLLEVVDRLMPLYPLLSRDLCLAGAFLHDIGKTWELSYEAAFNYTNGGQLIGHVVKGAMMVEEKARAAEKTLKRPLSREIVELVQHMVLSHHEKLEHGSPKPPSTPEAVFVAMIDNLDAKVHMALAAARGPSAPSLEESLWTEFLKPFGYRMYRPDPTLNPSPEGGVLEEKAEAGTLPGVQVQGGAGGSGGAGAAAGGTAGKGKDPAKVAISNPLFETAFMGKKK
jgi:3'-5' exoribonuclease